MMTELRKLAVLMRVQGYTLDARWIPPADINIPYSLFLTWDPDYFRATESFPRFIIK